MIMITIKVLFPNRETSYALSVSRKYNHQHLHQHTTFWCMHTNYIQFWNHTTITNCFQTIWLLSINRTWHFKNNSFLHRKVNNTQRITLLCKIITRLNNLETSLRKPEISVHAIYITMPNHAPNEKINCSQHFTGYKNNESH